MLAPVAPRPALATNAVNLTVALATALPMWVCAESVDVKPQKEKTVPVARRTVAPVVQSVATALVNLMKIALLVRQTVAPVVAVVRRPV